MHTERFIIESSYSLSLQKTINSHGWAKLSPWVWDNENGVLYRRDMLPSSRPVSIRVHQISSKSFNVEVDIHDSNNTDIEESRNIVRRWLSIDWNPEPVIHIAALIDPEIAQFIQNGGGRLLRSSTFYEDFAKTVCTIQMSWSGTQRMVRSLVDLLGNGMFPTPTQVLDAGESELREKIRLGFRAPQLLEATQTMLDQGLMDTYGRESDENITYEELIGMRGIGPYSASHVMMMMHDFSRMPIDSAVTRHYRKRHGLRPDEIDPFLSDWGDYRALGDYLQRLEISNI